MENSKVSKTISRLAVVAKDFSTYYIPGITMIVDKQVNQIAEIGDEFHILDKEGEVLSRVQKSAPCVIDYTDVYEVPNQEYLKEIEAELFSFGNYLLNRYNVMVMSNDGSNEPIYQRSVTDADLKNWQYSLVESK